MEKTLICDCTGKECGQVRGEGLCEVVGRGVFYVKGFVGCPWKKPFWKKDEKAVKKRVARTFAQNVDLDI